MQLTLYIVTPLGMNHLQPRTETVNQQISFGFCRKGVKIHPGLFPQKPLRIRENWCRSYPLRKGFPRNCCMRETAVKNCLPFPVQVEGHEISDSLMEFFSESHEIMVVFPWKFEGSILGGPVLPRNLFGLGSIATCYSLCRSPLVFFRHGATGTPLGSESWRMWFLWGDENICGDEHSKQRHWISKNCSFTKHQKKLMKSRTNLSLGFFQIIISQLFVQRRFTNTSNLEIASRRCLEI